MWVAWEELPLQQCLSGMWCPQGWTPARDCTEWPVPRAGFKVRCTNFWSHKESFVHPAALEERGIKVHRIEHRPGQIMIVAPGAYHWRFNAGFNIAEAINFASLTWIECGLHARLCDWQVKMHFNLFNPIHMHSKLVEWVNYHFPWTERKYVNLVSSFFILLCLIIYG